MEWYYANGGNRVGPVQAPAFETLVNDGIIKPDTLVWAAGMPEWQPWSAVGPDTAACVASRGRFLKREMVPYEGGFVANEHKAAYFQRLSEGVGQPGRLVFGGFWIRFGAKFIDGIITGIVGQLLNLLLTFLFFGAFIFQPKVDDAADTARFFAYLAVSYLVGIGLGLAYQWFFLSRYEATPGKLALGLKVVRADGSRLTTGRIIGRYFAEMLSSLILGIGYLMAAFDEEKRTLHDRICDTRVVKGR